MIVHVANLHRDNILGGCLNVHVITIYLNSSEFMGEVKMLM